MRTAIVGLGITGMSCLRHLAGGDELVVIDSRPQPPGLAEARAAFPAVEFRLGTEIFDPGGFDRAILSPGIAPRSPLGRRVLASGLPVLSDIDLFFAEVREPVYLVTGTNGKSTVTSLIGHLLAVEGARAGVGGNLGLAALDAIESNRDCYVLELSSFQLERSRALRCHAATILNLSRDHLDWHGNMYRYVAAKQRIYAGAQRAVANRHDPRTWPLSAQPAEHTTFGRDAPAVGHWGIRRRRGRPVLACGERVLFDVEHLPLAGNHNEQNLLAALAMVHGGDFRGDESRLVPALSGFRGLPHRCETVATINGVTYINDSKATNVGAALAALAGFADDPGGIVLIAGGEGKDADFAAFGEAIAVGVRHLVVLGADGPAIARAVCGRIPVSKVRTMGEAVRRAVAVAESGDRVLLSPACASFDQFENFEARGLAFCAAVAELRRPRLP